MAEYLYNEVQTVPANGAAQFIDSIPCNRGNVYHESGTGIFILRGNTPNCFARYQVTYNGNIAVSTGGTAEAVSVALAVNGEARPTSTATVTPAAAQDFFNVTSTAIITVPRGCCFSVSLRNVSTQSVDLVNSNLIITRIA